MNIGSFVRKIVLILGDIVCLILATNLAMYFEWGANWSEKADFHMQLLPILIFLMFIMFNVYGLFSYFRKRLTEIFLNLFVALVNIFVVAVAITFLARDFDYSRMVLLKSAFWAFVFLYLWQYLMHQWEVNNMPKQKTVLFAKKEEQNQLSEKIKKYAFISKLNRFSEGIDDNKWQEKINDCCHIIIGNSISVTDREEIINYAKSNNKIVFLMPTFYEICCRNISLYKVDDLPLHRISRFSLTVEQRVLKRTLDILVATIAAVFSLPILLLTAIAIRVDSPGPIFYSQERVGRHGKTFYVHKLRSMYRDAEALTGPMLSCEGDQRITRLGRFIRATRIDELPQIFNVLVGEMSLVGPRPERPIFVNQYIKERPEYAYRLNVKPGITGPAQIYGKYNTDAYDKLVYDLIYIQNVSVVYDLTMILQTLGVLLNRQSTEGVQATGKMGRQEIR